MQRWTIVELYNFQVRQKSQQGYNICLQCYIVLQLRQRDNQLRYCHCIMTRSMQCIVGLILAVAVPSKLRLSTTLFVHLQEHDVVERVLQAPLDLATVCSFLGIPSLQTCQAVGSQRLHVQKPRSTWTGRRGRFPQLILLSNL